MSPERANLFNTGRLDHIYQDPHEPGPRLQLHYGDLTDSVALANLLRGICPDEVYHLGAQSHVKVSFEIRYPYQESVSVMRVVGACAPTVPVSFG